MTIDRPCTPIKFKAAEISARRVPVSNYRLQELADLVFEVKQAEKILIPDRDAWGTIISGIWLERAESILAELGYLETY